MEEEFEPEEEYVGESSGSAGDRVDEENMDPGEAAFMEGYDAADDIDKDSDEDTEEEESI